MSTCQFVVLTNAVDGQDETFNDWYTNQHLGDVVKLPGVISAKRYRLAPHQRSAAAAPFQYLALYEIELDKLEDAMRVLNDRRGTELMPISDSLDPNPLALVFQPIPGAEAHRSPS